MSNIPIYTDTLIDYFRVKKAVIRKGYDVKIRPLLQQRTSKKNRPYYFIGLGLVKDDQPFAIVTQNRRGCITFYDRESLIFKEANPVIY